MAFKMKYDPYFAKLGDVKSFAKGATVECQVPKIPVFTL